MDVFCEVAEVHVAEVTALLSTLKNVVFTSPIESVAIVRA